MAARYNTNSATADKSSGLDLRCCGSQEKTQRRRSRSGRLSLTMALFVAVTLCLCNLASGLQNNMDGEDIQSFLEALQNPEGVKAESTWGIPDKTATLGKLFQYTLSNEALNGEVKELGKDHLPSWLTLDKSTGLIQGVPGSEQLDQEYFLEVVTPQGDGSQASDVFSIKVTEDKVHTDSGATKLSEQTEGIRPIKCPAGSSVTMATIIVDVDLGEMQPAEKVGMMRGMCGHLSLPDDVLKVAQVGDKPMFDSAALVAGPGDVKQAQTPGAMIQWVVGCGNVHAHHMPILQQLETTSSDGTMGRAVNHGIVGWHVTNNKPHAPIRLKRAAWDRVSTATPVVPGGTPPTRRPVPTMTSRVHPTETRKPHRTKTHGRHDHKTKHPKGHKKSRKSKHPKQTPAPTATHLPIQPTRTADVMPTDTYMTASPGVSRTHGVIEPSMMPTKTWSAGATDMLPSMTPSLPGATDRPEPSRTDDYGQPTDGGTEGVVNYEPVLKNDIKRLPVRVGDILDFKVPSKTFFDFEDGNTENLKLMIQTIDGLGLSNKDWLKFNATTQTLTGLPLPEHVGRQEYFFIAIDSGGKIARDPFEIAVIPRPHDQKINHEFSMTLDMDFKEFTADVDKRIDVAKKIASVYGDKNMNKITVTRLASGSVIYAWTNNSVPLDPCPVEDITHLLQYLITENNTLNETFVEAMKPYRILKAGAVPKGSCDQSSPTPEPTDPIVVEPRETSNREILITTVVPAVVIAAMLLLAGCIACILYRKKRKGKLSDEDQQTFINKGIPIIFADELEEKSDQPNKPLIDEKPPQPPPEYQRSAGGSVMSTPPSDHKEPLMDTDDDEDEMHSAPYRPPPPVAGSQGNRQARPHAQPPYRQPPPYVPP